MQGGGKFFLLTGPERAGEGSSSLFPGKLMTASGDRPARGFIQLFHPGLLVLLEALEVSFCHSSHRLPSFSVTFFFQFNRLTVRMLPFCQHLPVLSLFISAIFCFLRPSPRKYRKYALLCCSCSFPPFCHAFSSCDFPFFLFRFLLFSSAISSNRSGRYPHSLRLFRTVKHKELLLSDICVHSP